MIQSLLPYLLCKLFSRVKNEGIDTDFVLDFVSIFLAVCTNPLFRGDVSKNSWQIYRLMHLQCQCAVRPSSPQAATETYTPNKQYNPVHPTINMT